VPVGAQAIRVSKDGGRLFVGDFNRPLLHVLDTRTRALTATYRMAGVPGWPFVSPDGRHLAVTTYNEADDQGFLELFDVDTMDLRRSIELPGEPFHVLFTEDSLQLFVVQADGDLPLIDIASASIVEGGMTAGGTMPEAMVYWDGPTN